jgi:hypothetical protein
MSELLVLLRHKSGGGRPAVYSSSKHQDPFPARRRYDYSHLTSELALEARLAVN